jgi:hypothetical protein
MPDPPGSYPGVVSILLKEEADAPCGLSALSISIIVSGSGL